MGELGAIAARLIEHGGALGAVLAVALLTGVGVWRARQTKQRRAISDLNRRMRAEREKNAAIRRERGITSVADD